MPYSDFSRSFLRCGAEGGGPVRLSVSGLQVLGILGVQEGAPVLWDGQVARAWPWGAKTWTALQYVQTLLLLGGEELFWFVGFTVQCLAYRCTINVYWMKEFKKAKERGGSDVTGLYDGWGMQQPKGDEVGLWVCWGWVPSFGLVKVPYKVPMVSAHILSWWS